MSAITAEQNSKIGKRSIRKEKPIAGAANNISRCECLLLVRDDLCRLFTLVDIIQDIGSKKCPCAGEFAGAFF